MLLRLCLIVINILEIKIYLFFYEFIFEKNSECMRNTCSKNSNDDREENLSRNNDMSGSPSSNMEEGIYNNNENINNGTHATTSQPNLLQAVTTTSVVEAALAGGFLAATQSNPSPSSIASGIVAGGFTGHLASQQLVQGITQQQISDYNNTNI